MKMEPKNLKRKFITLFISLFIVILLLEIALRIAGIIHLKSAASDEKLLTTGKNVHYTILCLGDSFTDGIGASQGKDYPNQLENLLNSRAEGKIIRVINGGIPGDNAAQVLNKLQRNIDIAKPCFIILLVGCNSWHNYYGYYAYLKKKNVCVQFFRCLHKIRIYELAKFLYFAMEKKREKYLSAKEVKNIQNIKGDFKNQDLIYKNSQSNLKDGWTHVAEKNYKEAIKWFKEGVKAMPKNSSNYYGVGEVYKNQGKYEQAIKWFKEGIKLEPKGGVGYCGIGWSYSEQQKNGEARKWFRKGIKAAPKEGGCYYGLGFVYQKQGKYEEAIKWFKEGVKADPGDKGNYRGIVYSLKFIPGEQKRYDEVLKFFNELAQKDNPGALSYVKLMEKSNVDKAVMLWFKSDLTKIIKICQNKKIKIILQNYPSPDKANEIIEKLARDYFLPFVNNYQIFSELRNRKDFFVPDGHCNAKGYGVMAENVYDKIMEGRMLDLK